MSIRKQAKTVSEVPQGAVPQVTKGPAKDETEGKKAEGPPPRPRRSGVPLLPRWGSDSLCSSTSRALVGGLESWSDGNYGSHYDHLKAKDLKNATVTAG